MNRKRGRSASVFGFSQATFPASATGHAAVPAFTPSPETTPPALPFLGFWADLRKKSQERFRATGHGNAIVVLAPMADVTDAAFREIIAKYSRMGQAGPGDMADRSDSFGGPDAMWTEFVSADGLFLGGRQALERDLKYTEGQRPIVAQFFTSKPELLGKAVELARQYGFDGVDINMGCPDRSIEKQGAGASLIKNPGLASRLILSALSSAMSPAMFQGTSSNATSATTSNTIAMPAIPISIKTRIGYNKDELKTWLPAILATSPAVVTIHARTRKEMSLVPARMSHIKEAVAIRDAMQSHIPKEKRTLIFANGDIKTLEQADQVCLETGADGAMLGRAIFGNPWLFDRSSPYRHPVTDHAIGYTAGQEVGHGISRQTIQHRLEVMLEHTQLFEKYFSGQDGHKNFAIMKKHYKAYVNGWPGAKELRTKLMDAKNASEVADIVQDFKNI